jgi:hypothetical protein
MSLSHSRDREFQDWLAHTGRRDVVDPITRAQLEWEWQSHQRVAEQLAEEQQAREDEQERLSGHTCCGVLWSTWRDLGAQLAALAFLFAAARFVTDFPGSAVDMIWELGGAAIVGGVGFVVSYVAVCGALDLFMGRGRSNNASMYLNLVVYTLIAMCGAAAYVMVLRPPADHFRLFWGACVLGVVVPCVVWRTSKSARARL